jgi:hypothetical protein
MSISAIVPGLDGVIVDTGGHAVIATHIAEVTAELVDDLGKG